MSFVVSADCTYLGKSQYPRAGGLVGNQVHLLSGVESAKVACDDILYQTAIPEGTRVRAKLDFLATKKGNFLKALELTPLPALNK